MHTKDDIITSILLKGDIDPRNSADWKAFYLSAKTIMETINAPPNYVGVTGTSFKSGKVLAMKSVEKRLLTSFEKGEEFRTISLFSLPSDFEYATFDYEVYLGRTLSADRPRILASFSNKTYQNVNVEGLLNEMRKYISFHSGQVFTMSRAENPQVYASGINDNQKHYETLKVIHAI